MSWHAAAILVLGVTSLAHGAPYPPGSALPFPLPDGLPDVDNSYPPGSALPFPLPDGLPDVDNSYPPESALPFPLPGGLPEFDFPDATDVDNLPDLDTSDLSGLPDLSDLDLPGQFEAWRDLAEEAGREFRDALAARRESLRDLEKTLAGQAVETLSQVGSEVVDSVQDLLAKVLREDEAADRAYSGEARARDALQRLGGFLEEVIGLPVGKRRKRDTSQNDVSVTDMTSSQAAGEIFTTTPIPPYTTSPKPEPETSSAGTLPEDATTSDGVSMTTQSPDGVEERRALWEAWRARMEAARAARAERAARREEARRLREERRRARDEERRARREAAVARRQERLRLWLEKALQSDQADRIRTLLAALLPTLNTNNSNTTTTPSP